MQLVPVRRAACIAAAGFLFPLASFVLHGSAPSVRSTHHVLAVMAALPWAPGPDEPPPTTTTTHEESAPPTDPPVRTQRGASEVPSQPTVRNLESAPANPSLQPCGGDLPPCWVAERESHGNYGAVSPDGRYWGKWQFDLGWAGKLGLPADLSQATPEQQDNAARLLWAGGAGCGNWGAC